MAEREGRERAYRERVEVVFGTLRARGEENKRKTKKKKKKKKKERKKLGLFFFSTIRD